VKVLFHLTIRRPSAPWREAVWQEIDGLRGAVGGELNYLNPSRRELLRVPRLFFGFHQLRWLKRQDSRVDLHHVYNPDPFPFPILRWLNRPKIYTLSAGLTSRLRSEGSRPLSAGFFCRRIHTVVVSNERDRRRLIDAGIANVRIIPPGVDLSRISPSRLPLSQTAAFEDTEITLMAGSAPWVRAQFRSKGVDALLDVAQRMPRLRLIFLWRGVLYQEMQARVRERRLTNRVEILDQQVDVNAVLARVHASVLLADDPSIVKAFPHSLVESLAAAKPVLVSRDVPLAHLVTQWGCGQVVDEVTPEAIISALRRLVADYAAVCQAAANANMGAFSRDRMVGAYMALYDQIANGR
jgi:glycosyltransferase involved in cell wall biosynthesis